MHGRDNAGMPPTSPSPANRRPRRRWAEFAFAVALLAAVGGLAWRDGGPAEAEPGEPRLNAAAEAPGPSASASPVMGEAEAASSAPPVGPALPSQHHANAPLDPALLASIEKQWCSHYAQAHEQSLRAVEQSYAEGEHRRAPFLSNSEFAARSALPTEKAREQVKRRVLARWIDRLDRAGDPRSAAIAASLSTQGGVPLRPELNARLRAAEEAALQSSDPVLLQLQDSVLMMCEVRTDCRSLARRRWQAVEPGNLAAWLTLFGLEADTPDRVWTGLAQAQYVRWNKAAIQARLLELMDLTSAGLEREVALGLVEWIDLVWPNVAPRAALYDLCKRDRLDSRKREACLHAANLMWNDPGVSELGRHELAMLADALGGSEDEQWAGRIRQINRGLPPDAVRQLNALEFGLELKAQKGCEGHEARLSRLKARVEAGG